MGEFAATPDIEVEMDIRFGPRAGVATALPGKPKSMRKWLAHRLLVQDTSSPAWTARSTASWVWRPHCSAASFVALATSGIVRIIFWPIPVLT